MFDQKLFEELYRKYYGRLYKYCVLRLGGDEDAASGAVDETFFTLYKKWDVLKIGDGVGTWLYKTAENRVRKALTRSARYDRGIKRISDAEEFDRIAAFSKNDVYFRKDAPEDDAIDEVRDALPEEYRDLFRMRFAEKKTLSDISEETGLPYSTLRRRIARITLAVREIVSDMYRDSDVRSGD